MNNVSHFSSTMGFLKLESSQARGMSFLIKAVCVQMFMRRYLSLEISENKDT